MRLPLTKPKGKPVSPRKGPGKPTARQKFRIQSGTPTKTSQSGQEWCCILMSIQNNSSKVMIIASSFTQQHIELLTREQNGDIRKLLSPPIYHSSYHQKHNELPPFCSAAHAFSKTALAWHYCTYLNAKIGQGSINIQFSNTVVTVCHKIKEETGCKSTPLAENMTLFLLFLRVINTKSCLELSNRN